jgi:hypothetical protein
MRDPALNVELLDIHRDPHVATRPRDSLAHGRPAGPGQPTAAAGLALSWADGMPSRRLMDSA